MDGALIPVTVALDGCVVNAPVYFTNYSSWKSILWTGYFMCLEVI